MKKALVLIFIIAFSLLLGGCFKKKTSDVQVNKSNGGDMEERGSTSLMDWLKRGKAVECTLSSPEGEISVKTKNNKVRIDGIPYPFPNSSESVTAVNGTTLTDGDWTYYWNDTEGMKMNNKKMEELSVDPGEKKNLEDNQWENMVGDWEKDDSLNYDCKDKNLSDDLFTPPANIEFTDFTVMMEQLSNIGKDLEKQMETGVPVDMEALQKAMEDAQTMQ